jgi:hypothetical protein
LPKGPQNGTDPVENGGERTASNEDARSSGPIAGNGQSETALDKVPPKVLTYYGSAARRHLRRNNNTKEPEQPTPVQQWFVDSNVHLCDELKSATTSPLQLVQPTPWKGYVGVPRREVDEADTALEKKGDSDILRGDTGLEDGVRSEKVARDPVPLPGKRYFVDLPTFTEVYYTAKGLLKIPRPELAGEVAAEKSHLILHYPAEGGSFLLDEVVQNLSQRMRCDLLVLDAQDISELVATSDHLESAPEEFMHASRLLSYEVFNREQRFIPEEYAAEDDEDSFDLEPQGDTDRPRGFRMGRPMIIAKTMNLSDLFSSAIAGSGPRGRSQTSRSFLGGISAEVSHRPKSPKHILAPLIDALLSTSQLKRAQISATKLGQEGIDTSDATESLSAASANPSKGLIIHVKDLRSIQETDFGGQFLSALYESVQQRRSLNEPTMIIGTEVSGDEAGSYSKSRIQEMQRGEQHEISRNIFLSPVTPNTDAKLALSEDKRRRTRIINRKLHSHHKVHGAGRISGSAPSFDEP